MDEQQTIAALKTAIEAQDWKRASRLADAMRFKFKRTYQDMAVTFGAEQWEAASQEMDDADTEE